jgi:chaperonin GroEL
LKRSGIVWTSGAGGFLGRRRYGFGFDAQAGAYKNMIAAGIVDPTKVVRIALQNTAAGAGLLITTEAHVAEHR